MSMKSREIAAVAAFLVALEELSREHDVIVEGDCGPMFRLRVTLGDRLTRFPLDVAGEDLDGVVTYTVTSPRD